MKRAPALLCAVLLFLAAAGLLAQSAGIKPSADVLKAGMDPERLARIPARMKEFVDKGRIAGAVTLVARHGVVASLEAVGYQDLESKKPMRTDTIFQIRSMTKSVDAVGIMILVEEGA
jgi:CubicO group peptidase (beta-lactamase class C family)